MNRLRSLMSITIFALAMMGCSPLVRPEQATHSNYTLLTKQSSLGQTFFSRYNGITGIDIYIRPDVPEHGSLTLYLKSDPHSEISLAIAQLDLKQIRAQGFVRLFFPPLWDSENKDFYFLLKTDSTEEVKVGTTVGDAYLHGALYLNGEPTDAQMSFRLVYHPFLAGLGALLLVFSWLPVSLIAVLLYVLPGWALLKSTWAEWNSLRWDEKLALSTSASLALYPILFLWSEVFGLRLGRLYAWIPAALGSVSLIWSNRHIFSRAMHPLHPKEEKRDKKLQLIHLQWSTTNTCLVIVLAFVFAARFWVIRNLEVPLWGDSYQHTLIAQLLVNNHGLFNSWQPYADLQTFTYHFGFHSLVAVFHWMTNLSMPQATLWVGQILNGLAVFALYPIAARMGNNRWAGIGAVLISGLLTQMPMFYLNWGRYTQLAGQVLLPGLIYILWQTLDKKDPDIKAILLNSILMGGLALTHYRVLIFTLLFLLALLFMKLFSANWRTLLAQVTFIGVGSGVLFLPWFLHIFSGKILTILGKQMSTPPHSISSWTEQYNAIGNLSTYLPIWLWLLLPLLLGFALWQRNRGVAMIALWWFLLILAANPRWLGLPGEGTLQNFTIFIAAYIPACLIAGTAIGEAWSYLYPRILFLRHPRWLTTRAISILGLLMFLGAALYGFRQRINDLRLNDSTLVTRPDLRAARWIITNTPENARFLVNSFFAYDNTLIVGSDAGWWLPLLTGRQTTLPPINYGSEQGPFSDYRQWVNMLTKEILDKGLDSPEVLEMLADRNVTHIYIGQRQGKVNNPAPALDPEVILASPYFSPIYHQDRVWIFQIKASLPR